MRRGSLVAAAIAAALMLAPAGAGAVIRPATVLDGPSADVLDVGGIAMAPDGTGGVVYRRRTPDGRAHIFAAQFVDGAWQPPQRVDIGQAFDSSWPRIAAGDGGRLMVVWVQEYGPGTDRLYSARLWPGARGFAAPVSVDLNIGEATATWPVISMNPGGATVVAYRVITTAPSTGNQGIPAGWVGTELRAARYRGPLWSSTGVLNRNTAVLSPPPTADNAPDLDIDNFGNAIIAWSEPDNDLIDRIWARRLYSGGGVGLPLLVSPQTVDGKTVPGGADEPTVSVAGNGAGVVAFRQDGEGTPSLGGRPRTMTNTIGDVETTNPKTFAGPVAVDRATTSAGAPSVSMDAREDFRVAFRQDGGAALAGSVAGKLGDPVMLDQATAGAAALTAAPDGGVLAAWPSVTPAAAGVLVSEQVSGAPEARAALAAPSGGPVSGLRMAGSGVGDALVAFRQGGDGTGAIVAGVVDGPPDPGITTAPNTWVRPAEAQVSWEPAVDAIGPVRYDVVLDGQVRASGLTTTTWTPAPGDLDDGTYDAAVLVTDGAGQQVLSASATLSVDGTPPVAGVRAGGRRRVAVRVSDGLAGVASGLPAGSTRIAWGDGRTSSATASATHRYARRGRYRVRISVRDKAGNAATTTRRVIVR